jgi:predicted GNAT family acetyltransferase
MAPLRVICTHDAGQFLEHAGAFLLEHPVEHSVLLTRSGQALEVPDVSWGAVAGFAGQTDLWVVVECEGQVVAAAMQTPPFPVALSLAPPEAVEAVADEVRRRRPDVVGVTGPVPGPALFAERWAELGGGSAQVAMENGIYAATSVNVPTGIHGEHRVATAADAVLLQQWAQAFEVEANGAATGIDHVTRRLRLGLLHVWQDEGRPVSMAAVSLGFGGVSRVQLVYTPPSLRGRGYASALVATITRAELDAGRSTMLYTDLANPTSNAIYQRIGYRRVASAQELRFG